MFRAKRLIVATLSGVLFGFVCIGLASSSGGPLPWPVLAQILASRTLIGLAIGISALRFGHWALHGLVMGLVFSLPLAFSGLMAYEMPGASAADMGGFSPAGMFIGTVVLGGIYGLLIEVITSVLFKAKGS